MKCSLSLEINNCPFCNKEQMECGNMSSCAFQVAESEKQKEKYIRKERWYEKYYKKR